MYNIPKGIQHPDIPATAQLWLTEIRKIETVVRWDLYVIDNVHV